MCNELDLPVIIVTETFEGAILPFIQNLSFECVILLDEAEKTFSKDENDDKILLSLIDGVYNNSRKLYVLTTNRLTVNENLLGRPGRIRYIQEFRNLPVQAVVDYCNDNLEDRSKLDKVLSEVDLLEISTIDILKAIVEEINIFGELSETTQMNIPKAKYIFDTVRLNGCTKDDFEQIERLIESTNPHHLSMSDWWNSYIKLEDLPEDLLAAGLKSSSFTESVFTVEEEDGEFLTDKSIKQKPSVAESIEVCEGIPAGTLVVSPAKNISSAKKKDSAKKKRESRKSKEVEVIHVNCLISSLVPDCTWTSFYRMTSNFKELWKDLPTSLGTIVESPNRHGLFILQDEYDKSETVYLLLRQKNNPSLYRGDLIF